MPSKKQKHILNLHISHYSEPDQITIMWAADFTAKKEKLNMDKIPNHVLTVLQHAVDYEPARIAAFLLFLGESKLPFDKINNLSKTAATLYERQMQNFANVCKTEIEKRAGLFAE